jgi:hypothetical protein
MNADFKTEEIGRKKAQKAQKKTGREDRDQKTEARVQKTKHRTFHAGSCCPLFSDF